MPSHNEQGNCEYDQMFGNELHFPYREHKQEQRLFDMVVANLRQQGEPALQAYTRTGKPKCVYLSENGNKCAVGGLIKPENYSPDIEGSTITSNLAVVHAVEKSTGMRLTPKSIHMLRALQTIHDRDRDVLGLRENWESGFRETANFYGLDYTAPQPTHKEIPCETYKQS